MFKYFFLIPIYIYRYCISPFTPSACRYFPSCSEYMIEAIQKHGVLSGFFLAIRRLMRCHPCEILGAGDGFDPVPDKISRRYWYAPWIIQDEDE